MRHIIIFSLLYLTAWTSLDAAQAGPHLFILSGQSNMAKFDPNPTFIPLLKQTFGDKSVIVVKSAQSGEPIRRWYKQWKPPQGTEPKATGDLYDQLMGMVKTATAGVKVGTVTFIWMQGERDAMDNFGEVYEASLRGLITQLQTDLKIDEMNVIIGRLSDYGEGKEATLPHWSMVRQAQMTVAESLPHGAWVDTDDLNNDIPNKNKKVVPNALHYSEEGYQLLGKRYAEKAIALINGSPSAKPATSP